MSQRAALVVRFWRMVDQSGPVLRSELGACWRWKGATTNGYGVLGAGGRGAGLVKAHRLSWEIANGTNPGALVVCHRCDNPECCNPAHLFLGTFADNTHDAMAKGRASPPPILRGLSNGKGKYSAVQVEEVRSLLAVHSGAEVARQLGVPASFVYDIKYGRRRSA